MVLLDTDGHDCNRQVIKESLYRLVQGNTAMIASIKKQVIMNSKNSV